jgi:aspartate/methionine/tyrosine aminotransferase
MKPTARRVADFLPSAFGEMTLLANQHGAVNLGQGFPDFLPPSFVTEALRRVLADPQPQLQQYAPPRGWLALQQALAEAFAPSLGHQPDPLGEVTITVGATQALYSIMQALLEPGEEVIVFEPQFDTYTPQILLAGGQPRYVQLHPGPPSAGADGWSFDEGELRAAINNNTKIILLNTPHNPTGKVFSRSELQTIADIAIEHNLYVLSDEVYDHLIYDGQHISIASLPGMRERTLTVGSAGKLFSVTGWRLGWIFASSQLSAAIRQGQQWATFAAATPVQQAVADCLHQAVITDYYRQTIADFRQKRDLLAEALEEAAMLAWLPEGGYFIVADVHRWLEAGFAANTSELSRRLVTEFGVAAMPASVFYSPATRQFAPASLRLAFCKRNETLMAASERLAKLAERFLGVGA